MSFLKEIPSSGNLVEREPIRQNLEIFYQQAKVKEEKGSKTQDAFVHIKEEELYHLGLEILATDNIWEAYDILAQTSQSGFCFYDLVFGPLHARPLTILAGAFLKFEPEKVEKGLDVGAGTGNSTLVLVRKCQEVVAVDLNPRLLSHAKRKLDYYQAMGELKSYSLLTMDALKLGFKEESFDLIIDHGLDSYLAYEEIVLYRQAIHRFLKTGGRYYRYEATHPEKPPVYQTTPKAKLAGEVVRATLSLTYAPFHEANNDFYPPFLAEDFGFEAKNIKLIDSPYQETLLRWRKTSP